MKYYKIGEFAKMADVSMRTIRYYDQIGLLKPSRVEENGYRLYTDNDFIKLQKILSLKYLGFSLDDIFSMIINESYLTLQDSLSLQTKMIDQKISSLQNIKKSLLETQKYISENQNIDWQNILKTIHFASMEKDIIQQYKDSTNIDIRIKLHEKYSTNPIKWFQWLYSQYQIKENDKVLEIGSGNGHLFKENEDHLIKAQYILSDISEGIIHDAKRELQKNDCFQFQCFDCHHIPYPDNTFDVVIANHVLFYLQDIDVVLKEIDRVLKKGGYFYCSTYGKNHMKEMTEIIKEYNPKIVLSNVKLYDVFGLENGYEILKHYFQHVELKKHKDDLLVDNADDLIHYILSCHGNQGEYILKDYESFHEFMLKKVKNQIRITKDAGMFICQK